MPWIESHSELRDHPKSKRMKRKLRLSEHETVGLLHYFWYWALEFAQDGILTGMSAEDIADGCRFTGDPDELITALIHAGFVDETDGERTIHDWFKHGGKLVLWRQKEIERSRKNRDKNKENPVNAEGVQRTLDVRTADVHPYVPTSNSNSYSNKEKDLKHIVDSDECDIAFEEWYSLFKGTGSVRKTAQAKWKLLWRDKHIQPDVMMNQTSAYFAFQNHKGYSICAATVFLNQERWKSDWTIPGQAQPARPEPKYGVHEQSPEELELMPRG